MTTQFSSKIEQDICVYPILDRWYRIPHLVDILLYKDKKPYAHIGLDPDFLFDGRSGGPLVDLFIPNLGTQDETKMWLIHDVLAYDVCLSFAENNRLLLENMRKTCGYGRVSSRLVWGSVSIYQGYFGKPDHKSREYPNLSKIHVAYL